MPRSHYVLSHFALSQCVLLHCVLLPALVLLASSTLAAAERPNVLLICIDDLKPTLGCYGDTTAITPNIDRLASNGVLFSAAYCNQAVCSPSRNSLMTGIRPQTLGIYDLPTHFRLAAPNAVTLSQHFLNQGYEAQGLGKILHVGHGNIDDAASWSLPSWRPKAPSYVLPESTAALTKDKSGKVRGPATESAEVSDETYSDGQIAREAVTRLGSASQTPNQPFFLAVGFLKPHLPFVAPKKYWDLYDPSSLPMPTVHQAPEGAPSYAPTSYGDLRNYSDMSDVDVNSDATTRHLIHGYYAATSYTDAQIGTVLDALDTLGLAGNTIVVLWGDHGWHLGDHGMWCKHTNYEQAARIPMIVSAPGKARGETTVSMVETVDLYPTLSELAGLEMPAGLDGKSFANVLKSPSTPAREFVTHVYPRNSKLGRAIRDNRYRFVEWKSPGTSSDDADIELYDYELDPLETKNISAEQPEIVRLMRDRLALQPEAKPQYSEKATKSKKTKSSKSKSKSKAASN